MKDTKKKRKPHYHILIVREDGRQYHNRILDWLQVRKHLAVVLSTFGLLVLGNIAFLTLAGRQGALAVQSASLRAEKARLVEEFSALSQTLDQTQQTVTESARKLAQMEELARQQNLRLPDLAGTGGPSNTLDAPRTTVDDPALRPVAQRILDLSAQVREVAQSTGDLEHVLSPHLDGLAHTPSIWPAKGFLASGFGNRIDPIGGYREFHAGLDISAPTGSPAVASAEGLVLETGWMTGYGNTVILSHGNGYTTLYGHLSKILVEPGQNVKRWDKIGLVGSTGRSTGPHLHYEVHRNGNAVNPLPYLKY